MFNIEGKLFKIVEECTNLIILDLLFCLCCLPIVTIGASKAAHHHVIAMIVKGEEGYVTKQFFRSFRKNLRRVTPVWIVFSFCILIGASDFYFCFTRELPAAMVVIFVSVASMIVVMWSMTFLYFTAIPDEKNAGGMQEVKESFLTAAVHLPRTLLMLLVEGIPILLIAFFTEYTYYIVTFFSVIGFSLLECVKVKMMEKS